MAELELDLKCEEDRQRTCCVCDSQKLCSNEDFICSKNCEKLFLLIQGLIVGNVLQSMFSNILCVGKGFQNESELRENVLTNSTKISTRIFDITQRQRCQISESVNDLRDLSRKQVTCSASVGCDAAESELLQTEKQMKPDVGSECSSKADLEIASFPVVAETDFDKSDSPCNYPSNTPQRHTDVSVETQHTISEVHHGLKSVGSKKRKCLLSLRRSTYRSRRVSREIGVVNSEKQPASLGDSQVLTSMIKMKQLGENCDENSIDKEDSRQVTCRRCGKLISKYYLYVHYRATHRDHLSDIAQTSISCSECGKLFMRKQALNAHKMKHHNHQFPNVCKHCGKSFANKLGLSWHMRQVHKMMVRQCGTCGETFENRREYKKHRRYKHAANSHVCHICGKGFKLKNALQAHLDAHAGVKLHFCEICGDGFVRFSSLCQHKNNLHGPKKSELPFKCHACPSTFRLQAWLDKHVAQKHQVAGSNLHPDCDLCRDSVNSSVSCPLHDVAEAERFGCHHCNKVFAKEASLKAHMKQHQEPQFACDVCHKKFTYKCNMQRHRDTHSADKPFYCQVCSKQFCTKFLLTCHMRMHNQDLLFKCHICGKGLTRKDYLKNHLKKMHPEAVHP